MELTPEDYMRRERDQRLIEEVDRPMRNYIHTNQKIPQSLMDHRKALLDLPDNSNPVYVDGILTGVTWPTKPK